MLASFQRQYKCWCNFVSVFVLVAFLLFTASMRVMVLKWEERKLYHLEGNFDLQNKAIHKKLWKILHFFQAWRDSTFWTRSFCFRGRFLQSISSYEWFGKLKLNWDLFCLIESIVNVFDIEYYIFIDMWIYHWHLIICWLLTIMFGKKMKWNVNCKA